MKINHKLAKAISLFLTAALLIFAYTYISNIVSQVEWSNISIQWFWLLASIALFIAYYLVMSLNWLWACRLVDDQTPNQQMLAFFASQPYKYLPTSLFSFSFRAVYARKLGMSVAKSSVAQLIENASLLITSSGVFLIFFAFRVKPLLCLLLIISGLIISLFIYNSHPIKLKYKNQRLTIDNTKIVRMLYLASLGWVLSGLSFICLNQALGLSIDFTYMMAANALAFTLSLLAVFAPGGLGVREFVYRQFKINVAAVIGWRILTFGLDFILGGVAILMIKQKNRKLAD